VKEYYDARAPEYDDWYYGQGQFVGRERPGWKAEVAALETALRALSPARTLDVACGTGYLTRWLSGEVTGLDQSEAMLTEARSRLPEAELVRADALDRLPFADGAFASRRPGSGSSRKRAGSRPSSSSSTPPAPARSGRSGR
jgi:demethylmenaquinone methyltransferase/2-methoxy-6-polyprenyl-1,4-benzoquinol methylase